MEVTGAQVAVRETPPMTVLSNDQLTYISRTDFVPPGLRGNVPAILACVATGRALGIDDMTAIRSIHIIDGKATFSAELMVMLVRRRSHSIAGEVGEGSATVTGKRADNGDTMTSTWTLAMAERAGLLGKSNWKKYPESMLWARAVSQLCRMLFADCFAGSTYTTEELGEEFTDSAGEPTAVDAPPPRGDEPVSQAPADTGEPASPAEDDGLFPPGPAAELELLEQRAVKLAEQCGETAAFDRWLGAERGGAAFADGLLNAVTTFEGLLAKAKAAVGEGGYAAKVPASAKAKS